MSHLLVAAIDFGTTFSGYAFSFRHDNERDPLKISANTWTAGSGSLVSLKTSTCVLFDPSEKFHSFGFEAEDKYSNLALDEEHEDWYYFRRFKMMLYEKTVCSKEVTTLLYFLYLYVHSLLFVQNNSIWKLEYIYILKAKDVKYKRTDALSLWHQQ